MGMKSLYAAAAILALSAGAARADLVINPNGAGTGQATPEAQPGPGFPLGLTGYTDPALLIAHGAGVYSFTFIGAGDAVNTNTFTVNNGTPVAAPPGEPPSGWSVIPAATISNTTTALYGTFYMSFAANTAIDFTLVSTNVAGGTCTISSGTTGGTGIGAPCSYLVALPNGSFTPSQPLAYIGFADWQEAIGPGADYQDLVIEVREIPEPATLALLGSGLLGLGLIRRRRAA